MPRMPREFEEYDAERDIHIMREAKDIAQDQSRQTRAVNAARRKIQDLEEFVNPMSQDDEKKASEMLGKGYRKLKGT